MPSETFFMPKLVAIFHKNSNVSSEKLLPITKMLKVWSSYQSHEEKSVRPLSVNSGTFSTLELSFWFEQAMSPKEKANAKTLDMIFSFLFFISLYYSSLFFKFIIQALTLGER